MLRQRKTIFVAGLLALVLGCSKNTGSDVAEPGAGAIKEGETKAMPARSSGGPELAVHEFLEAVRTGDNAKANNLLTPVAREKTSEMGIEVAPPGSATASFKITEVEYVTEDGAHVASSWSDVDGDGQKRIDEIIWVLRKEPEGWRIAGMVTRVFPDQPPMIMNFEEPADMLEKQRLAEEEAARRSESAGVQTADRPAQPTQTAR